MSQTPKGGPDFAAIAGLVLLILFGIMIWKDKPLESVRSFDNTSSKYRNHSEEDHTYDSWAWGDPFDYDLNSDSSNTRGKESNRGNRCSDDFNQEFPNNAIDVLVQMVDVKPDNANREIRSRNRYAVIAGLSEINYFPSPRKIHYCFEENSKGAKYDVRWEKYVHKDNSSKHPEKIVIWLDNDKFSTDLEKNIDKLFNKKIGNLYIIGPANSDTLKEIKSKLETFNTLLDRERNINGLYILSPFATTRGIGSINDSEHYTFLKTINDNDKLMEKLKDELEKRKIGNLCDVIIIAERDTEYSRDLVNTSKKSLCKELKIFYYSQGIDSYLQTEPKDNQTSNKSSHQLSVFTQHNSPSGSNQYDYLYRLAIQIKKLQKDSKKSIRAIGIFGSDINDKIMILGALRSEKLNPLFFTTDLDAQMLNPKVWHWTRNLVVASNFDLRLKDDCQQYTPPFRDSYQTSLYLATILQIGTEKTKCINNNPLTNQEAKNTFPDKIPPLLFEIGRNGPIHLIRDEKIESSEILHPQSSNHDQVNNLELFLWAVIISIAIYIVSQIRAYSAVLILWLGLSAFILFISTIIAAKYTEESLSFTGGYSIWPTILIRTFVVLFICAFIFKSLRDLHVNSDRLNRKYFSDKDENKLNILCKDTESISLNFFKLHLCDLQEILNKNGIEEKLSEIGEILLKIKEDLHEIKEKLRSIIHFVIFWEGFLWKIVVIAYLLIGSLAYWCIVDGIANNKSYLILQVADPLVWVLFIIPAMVIFLKCIYKTYERDPVSIKEDWIEKETKKIITREELWGEYHHYGRPSHRSLRLIMMWTLFLIMDIAFLLLIHEISPISPSPCRGATCDWEIIIHVVSFLATMFLIFFVLDAQRLCLHWIRKLRSMLPLLVDETTLKSPEDNLRVYLERNDRKAHQSLEEIITLVAKRTHVVDKLIYYPLIAIMLMLFSRINYFDSLDFPLSISIVFAASFSLLIFLGLKLRAEASKLKRITIERIETLPFISSNEKSNTIDKILAINHGAFQPMMEQPAIRSLLLFFGSIGLFAGEYLMIFGFK